MSDIVQTDASPRFFAVTTPGVSATRWLAHVLAAHADVYVAHGKHPLDAVMRGNFNQEKRNTDLDSLMRGNAMRQLYEEQSLEEVFARFQETKPEARVFGCVHSYTLDALIRAARSPLTLSNVRVLNLVRHPVNYIASHYALIRSAERYAPLYHYYMERVFPQTLQEFPELFLMPCTDHRAFLAFAASCLGVANLIRDLSYPGVRNMKMEELTTRAEVLQSVCQELTGLSYSEELLRTFVSRGAINRHRSPGSSNDPHTIYTNWETWQQDMVQVMIPGTVLNWLEEMDYDVTMFRSQPSTSGTAYALSSESPVPSLTDHLRILDQRHPHLAYLTEPGSLTIQFIETEQQGFHLVHQEGKVYTLAQTLDVQDLRRLDTATLRELEVKGLCFCTDSVAEAWVAISRSFLADSEAVAARVKTATPLLIEQGYREFNLIAYEGKVFAAAQCLGSMDLTMLQDADLEDLRGKEQIYVANSIGRAKRWIDLLHERLQPRLLAPAYRGFHLVAYSGSVWAVALSLGPLDLTALPAADLTEYQRSARIFVASSAEEARSWIDQLSCIPKRRSLFSTIYRLAAGRFR
ncbi:MAG TPA: hypothetical protein VH682_18685 [Gemmataceae bacterium]